MKNPGSVWGDCKYRRLSPILFGRNQKTRWGYICDKDGRICNPEYCLGPDEDATLKGETDEEELDQ